MFTSMWPYIVPGTTLDHPLAMLGAGVWFIVTFFYLRLRGFRPVDPATERRERRIDLFLYLNLGVSLGSFFVLLAVGVHSPTDGPTSMGRNALLLVFLSVLVVMMAVGLYDMGRQPTPEDQERARWTWALAGWLVFLAGGLVLAHDELNQRAYDASETAVMLLGASLAAGLTAGLVGVWWWLRH